MRKSLDYMLDFAKNCLLSYDEKNLKQFECATKQMDRNHIDSQSVMKCFNDSFERNGDVYSNEFDDDNVWLKQDV